MCGATFQFGRSILIAWFLLSPLSAFAQDVLELDEAVHPPRVTLRSPAGTSAASDEFDAVYYHLTLDLDFEEERIIGQTLVQGRVASGTLDTLVLDLHSGMGVTSVRTPDGDQLPFAQSGSALRIDLPGVLTADEEVAVVVSYSGPPGLGLEVSFVMGERANGDPFAWTLSEPYGARQWWPSRDHPSDKADSVRITVTVPEGLTVASNGLLRQEPVVQNGRVTYDWFSRYPISTYLVSIAVGVYDYHEQTYVRPPDLEAEFGPLSLPIEHYEYRGSSFFADTSAIRGWDKVVHMFRVFERWFGPYPFPEEKYGHAQFTWGGGMEHQTISSMGGSTVGLIAHELAHQWFGDLITLESWPHLWLNEGFASYAELLYYEEDGERFWNSPYEQVFNLEYGRARAARGTLVVQDTASFNELFDATRVYAKGAMVLHMLRKVTGDEAFHQTLRTYAASDEFRYGNANTADFQAVAEAVSGRDLDTFFRQWVTEGTGEPVYQVRWYYEPAETGYQVTVDLEQLQSMDEPNAWDQSNVEVFVMPVTFEVHTDEYKSRVTFQNDRRVQRYQFNVPLEPRELVFDPDKDVLHRSSVQAVRAENPSPERPGLSIQSIFPNPASADVTIRLNSTTLEATSVELFDVLGRVIGRVDIAAGENEATISVQDLASGLYFVRINDASGSEFATLIVAR